MKLSFRAKQKVKVKCAEIKEPSGTLTCIGIDGKVDKDSLVSKKCFVNGEAVLKIRKDREHHLTFTDESDSRGEYLTHRTIPLKGATADELASTTIEVLEQYGSLDSVQAILLDNTSVNVGHKNGLIIQLQNQLNRSLHLIGCTLHQNELPFRSIFTSIDGESTGPGEFKGPIGIACSGSIYDSSVITFKKLASIMNEKQFPQRVISDLSSDQRILWEYCISIKTGNTTNKFLKHKIGPSNNARWLTLASRILCLYTRTTIPSSDLTKLVKYIINVHAPACFSYRRSTAPISINFI